MHYKTAAINHPDRASDFGFRAVVMLRKLHVTLLKIWNRPLACARLGGQRISQPEPKEQRWPASPFWQRRHTGPAELTELPRHAALAHIQRETPL